MSRDNFSQATLHLMAVAILQAEALRVQIEKGLLTPAEAASAFTRAANKLRDNTEDFGDAASGETIAQAFEQMAAQMLR